VTDGARQRDISRTKAADADDDDNDNNAIVAGNMKKRHLMNFHIAILNSIGGNAMARPNKARKFSMMMMKDVENSYY
jgi:hypothetical protein